MLSNKTFLLVFFVFILCTQLQAQKTDSLKHVDERENFLHQTSKYNIFVGVNFGLGLGVRNQNTSLNESTVLFDFNINPKVGFYPFRRLMVGVAYDYYTSLASINYSNNYQFNFQSLNGFTRYYFPKGMFGEAQLGWGNGSERLSTTPNPFTESLTGTKFSLGLGVGNFWGKNYHLEILARYIGIFGQYKIVDDDFYINGLKITAGLTYGFGK
ncbi:hypothetical protein R9C00_12385 [Flammeovirgaceae bacterium SG7u.111]|nr:hypothetical protein [Flammeovirgaceae bacterium SG7u.132]WPO38250.1 hypothetical protein R9C00_12385 [Flammeovirgaceae bacterium SG7u.111]